MKEYKPFKMKRGPLKVKPMKPSPAKGFIAAIIPAIKAAAAAVGKKLATTAAGKALVKVAATKVGGTTVGKIVGKQALSAGVSKIFSPKPPEEVEKTGIDNFSKLNFGNRSTFTMKRNIKK